MTVTRVIPLIVDGVDVSLHNERVFGANDYLGSREYSIQGATEGLCLQSVESCAKAFQPWKETCATQKRALFLKLAQVQEYLLPAVRVMLLTKGSFFVTVEKRHELSSKKRLAHQNYGHLSPRGRS
jgi:hypothetical protein